MTTSYKNALSRFAFALLLTLTLVGVGGAVSAQEPAATPRALSSLSVDDAIAAATTEDGVLRFEVAEDGTHFIFDPDNTHDDGMPAYGASFITRGYIYPAGTLDGSNGVNPDGSPEFPDKVLGEWICRGWMVGNGMRTMSGPMVVTTQLYTFGNELGTAMLVSDGYELADVGVEIVRPITGGSGPFIGAGGEGRQAMLGMNATEGVNLQYELEWEGAASE